MEAIKLVKTSLSGLGLESTGRWKRRSSCIIATQWFNNGGPIPQQLCLENRGKTREELDHQLFMGTIAWPFVNYCTPECDPFFSDPNTLLE